MCITGGESQPQPPEVCRQEVGNFSPKGFHPRLLADRQSKQPTLHKFVVG
ncbi:MAG: hypothetical protein LBU34_01390 [Planctomycetaceae bacterium]|nr:hypothetical protein [Planctomycetaceae bacterium]